MPNTTTAPAAAPDELDLPEPELDQPTPLIDERGRILALVTPTPIPAHLVPAVRTEPARELVATTGGVLAPEPETDPVVEGPLAWMRDASCRDLEKARWFPGERRGRSLYRAQGQAAIDVCMNECPVRQQCLERILELESGLALTSRWGIWAGLDPWQRCELDGVQAGDRPFRHQAPDVENTQAS